ncbi:hypothetical protein [Roseovarius salinarum]|uniref:hypothetical protein n=1 Tax=Roseovarius salinarum TaxID=1981892 RepID=UPI000C34819E|nr:hypothetical protein [Roseovarius salinarum]
MRERDWTNSAPEAGDVIKGPGITVQCLAPGQAAIISGGLDAAIASLAPGAAMIGLLDTLPESGAYALRIARDQVLLCTPEPFVAASGWHGDYALSVADDLYVPLQIEGDADSTFLSSCMSAQGGSPSAMALFAEKPCLVARTDGAAIRVWVPRPDMAEVWTRLALLSRV